MQTCNYLVVLALAVTATALPRYTFLDKEQEYRLKDTQWSIIEPAVVGSNDDFQSHNVHYEIPSMELHRSRRDIDSLGLPISYRLQLSDREHPIVAVLDPDSRLYTSNLVIEERFYNQTQTQSPSLAHCHFQGRIKGDPQSKVALSTCNGLTGMLMMSDSQYFIEPLKGHDISPNKPHPHVIYKSMPAVSPTTDSHRSPQPSCSTPSDDVIERNGSLPQTPGKERRRKKRSFSKDYYVETLVVVDHSMIEYYKHEDINTYIFTIMNMVSMLFHDASIGNSVNIRVVKLLLLDENQEKVEGLSVTHHAENTLESFCKWQKRLNPREPDDDHHDVAVLITRLDICSNMNEPCSTLGLAQVSGMCQPGRSCNINEDTGLALAYTIAHELGHNFGMKHDGFNECSMPSGEKSYIMYSEFLVDAGRPLIWSNCSQTAITRFLDRGWGFCLEDEPEQVYHYPYPDKAPGILYDATHQCKLQYGQEAEHCVGIENVCVTLWCSVNGRCVSRLEPAAEGTICDWENNTDTGVAIPKKWCFDAECTAINTRPEAINGGWADWTAWSECSRTCGGGVAVTQRHCTNPPPSNGGKYCTGERKKYIICRTDPCPQDETSFLEVQCAAYDIQPYKSVLYNWEPVTTNNPCQLNCKPKNRYFSVMLNDMVEDGTPCLAGTRNLCITGTCQKVGCDWKLNSNATEDRCGICHGDGSSCKTVKDQFKGQPPEGQGYVEATVIPAGARNIRIEEVAEANNYLAVKSDGDEYYLNGHWYIQWTGNYNMAGTTVHYERLGNKEGITAPGPIKEALHIMLLFQSHNPGVKFEYTVPNQNGSSDVKRIQEFEWNFLDWSTCSVSCGGGLQRKKVVCMEKVAGLVDDSYCNSTTKPDDRSNPCNTHRCPARWWTGPWQHCSASCGDGGVRRRTILCVRSLGPEEQMALEDIDCETVPKPISQEQCKQIPAACPSVWRAGPWSECKDPCDMKTREVICTATNSSECIEEVPPISEKPCRRGITCGQWQAEEWSQCSKTCGEGITHRTVECMSGDRCKIADRPEDIVPCNMLSCDPYNDDAIRHRERANVHNRRQKTQSNLQAAKDDEEESSESNVWRTIWNYMMGESGNSDQEIEQISTTQPPSKYNESWHVGKWSHCAATCGTGHQNREVWCPTQGLCDPEVKPSKVKTCVRRPCISWVAGSWSQCTVTCGVGSQQRNVQCINLESDQAVTGCDEQHRPIKQRECTLAKCSIVSAALRSSSSSKECEKDILALDTCRQLKDRGFCTFRYVSRNCCKLCGVDSL